MRWTRSPRFKLENHILRKQNDQRLSLLNRKRRKEARNGPKHGEQYWKVPNLVTYGNNPMIGGLWKVLSLVAYGKNPMFCGLWKVLSLVAHGKNPMFHKLWKVLSLVANGRENGNIHLTSIRFPSKNISPFSFIIDSRAFILTWPNFLFTCMSSKPFFHSNRKKCI